MHEALRKVLGTHVEQKGSMVTPEILRFDFSHFQKVTPAELRQVERSSTAPIRANYPLVENREATQGGGREVRCDDALRREVRRQGAHGALRSSVELCGGTHTCATGNIGFFKI